jgi:hypothetical protein
MHGKAQQAGSRCRRSKERTRARAGGGLACISSWRCVWAAASAASAVAPFPRVLMNVRHRFTTSAPAHTHEV